MLSEKLGKLFFWMFFIAFNITFVPQHWIGLLGMPRRIYTYSAELNLDTLNMVSSIGGFIQAFAILILVYNIIRSLRHGEPASRNPWNAPTLEWATESPPVEHNFQRIPTVHSREPLWVEREQVEAAAFGEPEPHIHLRQPASTHGSSASGSSWGRRRSSSGR
jgi:heme/copper-type cytochrome/quinol oxidase subunit 1